MARKKTGKGWLKDGLVTALQQTLARIPAYRRQRVLQHQIWVEELVQGVHRLSQSKFGALVVLERRDRLDDIMETGRPLRAPVHRALVVTFFFPHNPLQDGAMILRAGEIRAVNCLLPLTEQRDLCPTLGFRHRAALGVSEKTDAATVVVSGETGKLALAQEGKLTRDLTIEAVAERLLALG